MSTVCLGQCNMLHRHSAVNLLTVPVLRFCKLGEPSALKETQVF
uniref:Uncharacterized protein n=1 Tax=Arundo donax TaxID=35708 RepID=A0A0A9CVR5_ARUDO